MPVALFSLLPTCPTRLNKKLKVFYRLSTKFNSILRREDTTKENEFTQSSTSEKLWNMKCDYGRRKLEFILMLTMEFDSGSLSQTAKSSRKQETQAHFTTDKELIGLCLVARDPTWDVRRTFWSSDVNVQLLELWITIKLQSKSLWQSPKDFASLRWRSESLSVT